MSGGVAGAVLAAGRSTRMGQPKALLELAGRPFVARICDVLREAGVGPLMVVVGHVTGPIVDALDADVEAVVNRDYDLGMLSSLQTALAAVPEDAAGLLMALVDHPAVRVETVAALLTRHAAGDADIVIPTFAGRQGHPVIWGRRVWPELLAADPATGARPVIRRDPSRVARVPVDDPGIRVDVDRPEDYRRLVDGGAGR